MPCFDKKLEASRRDFYHEAFEGPEVDCVISTAEVHDLLRRYGATLAASSDDVAGGGGERTDEPSQEAIDAIDPTEVFAGLAETEVCGLEGGEGAEETGLGDGERLLRGVTADGSQLVLSALEGAGSGGYGSFMLSEAATELLGWTERPSAEQLVFKAGRNPDMQEAELEAKTETAAVRAGAKILTGPFHTQFVWYMLVATRSWAAAADIWAR